MPADTLSLAGKVAIVTGSGRENGIGAGIAFALGRNGASVVINHISDSVSERAAKVAETINKSGGRAIVVKTTVDTAEGAQFLVSETLKGFGTDRIDILVNNAGAGTMCSTETVTVNDLDKIFRTNVYGTVFAVQAVVPHMPRGGRIINISSTASKQGLTSLFIYGSSKAAVDSLTYAWADELGKSKGITVNALAPGTILTDIIPEHLIPVLTGPQLAITRAEERLGKKEDVGDAALLLVSEKSRWITGQYISVSGGVTGQ